MSQPLPIVVGIDVGGEGKGFHAVALRRGAFVDKAKATDPAVIARWCVHHDAIVVAVDAPCKWSRAGSSRPAERALELSGEKIHCFATPTRKCALDNGTRFYNWVFNGERLYRQLVNDYPLFDGERREGPVCIETLPHAIVCAMAGRVIPARPKGAVRRAALKRGGYDASGLPNIDFVDAALCAVAADEFRKGRFRPFGSSDEGIVVVAAARVAPCVPANLNPSPPHTAEVDGWDQHSPGKMSLSRTLSLVKTVSSLFRVMWCSPSSIRWSVVCDRPTCFANCA